MSRPEFRFAARIALLVAVVTLCHVAFGQPTTRRAGEGKPQSEYPLVRINEIFDPSKSDEEIVAGLLHVLDERIDAWKGVGVEERSAHEGFDNEAANLCYLMANKPYPAKKIERPEALRAVQKSVKTTSDFKNKDELNLYLSISLMLDGVHIPESQPLSDIALDTNRSKSLRRHVLVGFSRTEVPLQVLMTLLSSLDDDWFQISGHSDVPAASRPRRIFPLRDACADCLERLGVPCDRIPHRVERPGLHPLEEQEIRLNETELARKLREWIRLPAEADWRAAANVLKTRNTPEVQAVRRELKVDQSVPAVRRDYLAE